MAFYVTSIEEITIPSTVEEIGQDAFYGCENLKTVTLKEGLKKIGESAFEGTSIIEITIPCSVEEIGDYAFSDCYDLKTVTLSEGLKKIGKRVFEETSIEEITIPSSVKEIRSEAFFEYNNLTRIDCKLKKSYVEANKSKFEGLLENESIINWLNG